MKYDYNNPTDDFNKNCDHSCVLQELGKAMETNEFISTEYKQHDLGNWVLKYHINL